MPEGSCPNNQPLWNEEFQVCTACPSGERYDSATNSCIKSVECRSNADCKTGQYCFHRGGVGFNQEWSDEPGNAHYSGVCRNAQTDAVFEGAAPYPFSTNSMNMWSAARFCEAQGKQLVRGSRNETPGHYHYMSIYPEVYFDIWPKDMWIFSDDTSDFGWRATYYESPYHTWITYSFIPYAKYENFQAMCE